MVLVKKTATDKIEIVNANDIPMLQVRTSTLVEDDVTGEKFGAPQYSRHVVSPEDGITEEVDIVRNVAAQVHTAEVKAAYQAKKNANENSILQGV